MGGDGGYSVYAKCRPGVLRVTVHDDGLSETGKAAAGGQQPGLSIWADDTHIYSGSDHDCQVVTGKVVGRVWITTGWPGDHDFRIEYDCSND